MSRHSDRSSPGARSRHSDRSIPAARSRYSDRSSPAARSRHSDRSSPAGRARHRDLSRSTARSRRDISPHGDLSSPPYDRPRHDAVAENRRSTFPLPWDVYQKKIIDLLVDIRNLLRQAQPASIALHIEMMETMEGFEKVEQHLCDTHRFDTLVLQISGIGGKNIKDCVHKVLDRYVPTCIEIKMES
ncbi:hypothetical protein DPEC_G00060410 [Dallia pectoralis]|uniref:Uncharacterized protein n=1 Tax=Dallia pectoralis TaxID=75939 RepID=A0ACC2H7J7_DALPE|nr:hypothetical protein DPEC_G00060410 [Dallia pectoralis]